MPIRLAENFRAVVYAPFYASYSLWFYASEGVEVELVNSSTPGDGVSALLTGAIDITWGGPMRVMKAHDLKPSSPLVCFSRSSHATRSIWWADITVLNFSFGSWRRCDLRGLPK